MSSLFEVCSVRTGFNCICKKDQPMSACEVRASLHDLKPFAVGQFYYRQWSSLLINQRRFEVIHPSLIFFLCNPADAHRNFIVDASIQLPGCMLQVIKCLHLYKNFCEHLKDCDNDLMMKGLP